MSQDILIFEVDRALAQLRLNGLFGALMAGRGIFGECRKKFPFFMMVFGWFIEEIVKVEEVSEKAFLCFVKSGEKVGVICDILQRCSIFDQLI